jgi:large subunit ribosomal protein L17
MRHGKKINHLGRTASHRSAMLSNMASSLILHKRISTTLAKAKALRKFVEPLLTKAKNDTTHSRRTVFSYLQNKEVIQVLFDEVAQKIASRPGGYTRIIKTGFRLGDNAEMCIIELVDYNELMLSEGAAAAGKAKTRRSRRSTSAATKPATDKVAPATEVEKETPVAQVEEVSAPEAQVEETPQAEAPAADEPTGENSEEKA